jgi:molybdenum cofactor cytidylyltransferase
MSAEKANGKNFGIILLAAGGSSRLGRPKQLLHYDGLTLLQHSIQVAGSSSAYPLIVVLGAQADTIKKEIDSFGVTVIINAEWQEGMASSIRAGINALSDEHPSAEGAILMVCDQPYVTAFLLNDLIVAHHNTGKPIVACSYANTFGPPVLFQKRLFPELLQLKADTGARSVLKQHANEAEIISFPEGALDIDTEVDYQKLKDKREHDKRFI